MYFMHSSGPWKKHKYIKVEDGKYYYPDSYPSSGYRKVKSKKDEDDDSSSGSSNLWDRNTVEAMAKAYGKGGKSSKSKDKDKDEKSSKTKSGSGSSSKSKRTSFSLNVSSDAESKEEYIQDYIKTYKQAAKLAGISYNEKNVRKIAEKVYKQKGGT